MFELHIFEMKILKMPFRKNGILTNDLSPYFLASLRHSYATESVPYLAAHPNLTFQQDNAPAHAAQVTTNFLNNNNIQTLRPWPADSPASKLNLI